MSETVLSKSRLSNSEMFKDLIDIYQPEPVSWLPQTIGWVIVCTIIVIFLAYKLSQFARHRWQNRYRAEAINALDNIEETAPYQAAKHLSFVLKTVVNHLDSKHASLIGTPYLQVLDSYYQTTDKLFDSEVGSRWQQSLLLPEYQFNLSNQEVHLLINMSKMWLREHKLHVETRANAKKENQNG